MSKRWLAAAFALSFLWCPPLLHKMPPRARESITGRIRAIGTRKSAQNVTREKLAALPIS